MLFLRSALLNKNAQKMSFSFLLFIYHKNSVKMISIHHFKYKKKLCNKKNKNWLHATETLKTINQRNKKKETNKKRTNFSTHNNYDYDDEGWFLCFVSFLSNRNIIRFLSIWVFLLFFSWLFHSLGNRSLFGYLHR